jgi:hypothetical protein
VRADYGVVHAVAFQAEVAEDFPALHTGEGVLDAGSDLLVGAVGRAFPGGEFGLAVHAPVWHEQTGAWITAVCHG